MGTPVVQGQQTYNQFPAFAQPGQVADLAYAEIQSFTAGEVIQPGRMVEPLTGDATGQQIQQVQDATMDTELSTVAVGFSILITARESAGAFGITPYGVGGPQYNIGDTVPVLVRGRMYAEWKGTTQTAFSNPQVYHSSTVATDRGKITDAGSSAGAGTEVSPTGPAVRVNKTLANGGNIVLVDVNFPNAVS